MFFVFFCDSQISKTSGFQELCWTQSPVSDSAHSCQYLHCVTTKTVSNYIKHKFPTWMRVIRVGSRVDQHLLQHGSLFSTQGTCSPAEAHRPPPASPWLLWTLPNLIGFTWKLISFAPSALCLLSDHHCRSQKFSAWPSARSRPSLSLLALILHYALLESRCYLG